LYAALEVSTGRVHGKTAQRHTSEEFVGFCEQVVATQPPGREIHLIDDNLSAHKTQGVEAWLEANANVKIHYTPTYSSWLNQVELWFAKIERDCIARGYSPRRTIFVASCWRTSAPTTRTAVRSSGSTPIPADVSALAKLQTRCSGRLSQRANDGW
jgi:transposase